jgi:hypothetical protein
MWPGRCHVRGSFGHRLDPALGQELVEVCGGEAEATAYHVVPNAALLHATLDVAETARSLGMSPSHES